MTLYYGPTFLIFSSACAIELEDTVVVTGGYTSHVPIATVQVYNISGAQEQLPDLLTARRDHACAHFLDSQNRVVSSLDSKNMISNLYLSTISK